MMCGDNLFQNRMGMVLVSAAASAECALRRILITGMSGFIGYRLAAALRGDYQVYGLDSRASAPLEGVAFHAADLGSPELETLLERIRPEVIIHCAGSASVPLSMQDPGKDFALGPTLVFHLYDAVRKTGSKPLLLLFSSAAVYGNPERLPVRESDAAVPLSPYGWHKLLSEHIGREFSAVYGIPGVALRIFSCYGEGQKKLLLWDCASKLLAGGPATLFGTGEETRDYIHVDDLALAVRCMVKNADRFRGFEFVNVASGCQVSVASIARLLRTSMGGDSTPLVFSGERQEGSPLFWQADIARLRSLGFEPRVPLEEGVRRYAAWFCALQGRSL
jgi:UDP-glucose 4-epimerase